MTARPKTLKVGSVTYKIVDDEVDEADGDMNRDKLRIRINPESPVDRQPVTLLHEALHCVIEEHSIKVKHEERLVRALALGLIQVLRDNPEFVRFVRGV